MRDDRGAPAGQTIETPRWLRRTGLIVGPAAAITVLLLPAPGGLSAAGQAVLATALIMATWWITEALPIPATSLLPLVLFPLLDVIPMADASAPYAHPLVFLFLGGFIIALAVERSGLHRRLALRAILLVGQGPSHLVLGFMIATAGLSMWVSNTATVLLMLPIASAVIDRVREQDGEDRTRPFAVAMMLGLAYAASIGGTATLIGTPPNIMLAGVFSKLYPAAAPIGFLQWMLFALPVAALMLPLTWLLLVRVMPFSRLDRPSPGDAPRRDAPRRDAIAAQHRATAGQGRAAVREALTGLGPMTRSEMIVLLVFLVTAAAWMFRVPLELGGIRFPGLTMLLPSLDDGMIAMIAALLLFFIPGEDGRRLLEWSGIERRLPWGVLLLFGGGFALAEGMRQSGVTLYLGGLLTGLDGLPLWMTLLLICTVLTFLTEVTSNTATASILLPVLASAAVALGYHPLLFMVPAALNTSFAFMLPVATPPNAIVFSSGRVGIRQMAVSGLALNILGIAVVSSLMLLFGFRVFGIDPAMLPTWAR